MTKVLISLDPRVLRRIDAEAAKRQVSRSALIAEVAAQRLGGPLGPGADPAVHRALDRAKHLFEGQSGEDSTALIRADRDSRR
ncbi:MAG: ribbon-helix-helix protein, CopG family [Chloroflexi bacterium]|nr:ribbon-helix-helix protein, CopG family [Chloroflexota bacterium]